MRNFFLLGLVGAAMIVPEVAEARLVACDGLNCGTCEFVATVKAVLQFLLTLLSIIATIILAYVGLVLVSSGGSESAKTKAKTALTNIVIGFVLVLAAGAIVDTIMKVLVREDSSVLLNWERVQCVHAVTPSASIAAGGAGGAAYGIAALPEVTNEGLCNDAYLGSHFAGQEKVAQCVLQGESACGAYFYSSVDLARNRAGERVPFSVSPWQINLTAHNITAADVGVGKCERPINCTEAWSGSNYTATLRDEVLYEQCVRALEDKNCSGTLAQRIHSDAGGWSPWGAYRNNNCGR